MLNATERMFRLVYGRKMKELEDIPGPAPKFPFGTALDFATEERQIWEVCADYGRAYGGMTLIWFGGKPVVVLNDPVLVAAVLDTNQQAYYKDAPHKALLPIVTENSAFIANQPAWSAKRAGEPFMSSHFDDWLPTQIGRLQQVMIRHLDQWKQGESAHDVVAKVQRMSFDAFNEVTCGVDLGDEAYEDFIEMAKVGTDRMKSLLPIPRYPHSSEFQGAHERWFARFDALVHEARQNPDPHRTDLLSILVRCGGNLPCTALRDGIANVTYGGVFSVTSAIASALYLLAGHPKVAARLKDELSQHADPTKGIDMQTLDKCQYLDCVLRETLRYYCPVPIYFRNVLRDRSTVLGGHPLPPDTMVFITCWLIHRDPDRWARPDAFDPDRWLDGGVDANPLGSDYFFPFGRGPRTCVGVKFSMPYMRLALATILTHSKVDLDPQQPYRQGYFFGVMLPENLTATFG